MVAAYPAGGEALGNNTKSVSSRKESRRERRYLHQALAAELLPDERVSHCMRHLAFGKGPNVEIRYNRESESAHLHNLAVCGSVWTCAVCGQKISMAREAEIEQAIRAAMKMDGPFTLIAVTLTEQHELSDPLEDLLEDLITSTSKLQAGSTWLGIKKKWGVYATVSGLEVTFGFPNGYHPHKHMDLFCRLDTNGLTKDQKEQLEHQVEESIYTPWGRKLAKRGRYASPIYSVKAHIFDLSTDEGIKKAAGYVTKGSNAAAELASSMTKEGRHEKRYTPWQLLDLYSNGEKWAGARFKEYAKAMKGRRFLVWSRGAKQLFGLAGKDTTDEEIAEQETGESTVLVTLGFRQYEQVLAHRKRRPAVVGELLRIAGRGDPLPVWTFLVSLGVRPTEDQVDRAIFFGANTS